MSEPIEFYDKDGALVIMTSPNVAKELVAKGELFADPPLPEEEAVEPEKKVASKGRSRKPVAED